MTSFGLEVFCPECMNDVTSCLGERWGKRGPVLGEPFTHHLADSRHNRK